MKIMTKEEYEYYYDVWIPAQVDNMKRSRK